MLTEFEESKTEENVTARRIIDEIWNILF